MMEYYKLKDYEEKIALLTTEINRLTSVIK